MEKKKILIVEDEGIVAMEIKNELQTLGYDASTFASGEEAIQSLELSIPDLILMDIRLKGKMDGTETAGLIRKDHDIPVIYLTAHTDDGTLEKAKATVPYNYIVKPFDMKELHIAIVIALYRHKVEKEREQLTRKLQDALEKVKQLSGIIPICASCKKIRDDRGYWEQLESYITNHSEVLFSHGLCPDCAKKAYAELEELKKKIKKEKANGSE
jgi:CheY-like chemotaxis protein